MTGTSYKPTDTINQELDLSKGASEQLPSIF